MTTTTRNEAAERLRKTLEDIAARVHTEPGMVAAIQCIDAFGEALPDIKAEERRATVERIRVRLERIGADLPIGTFGGVYLVLDEEAAR